MADRREERERLRQERLAKQQRMTSGERRRQLMGYGAAGLLVAIVVVGIVVVVASGGDGGGGAEDAPENAFVVPETGTTAGLEFDGRDGTSPPEARNLNPRIAAREAGCRLREFPDEGNTHVNRGTKVDYKTDPPTSGNHYQTPLADGAYREFPDPRTSVHTLEHGRIVIQYSPELGRDEQLLLKGLFEEDPRGMVLFPNPRMPYLVAATAWRNSLTCRRWSERVIDAIRAFKEEFRGNGPENVAF